MSTYMLRRRKLGLTSCREIAGFANNIAGVICNDRPIPEDATMVIRWGTTSNVPCRNVVNKAEAIHRVSDKAGFRKVLMDDWVGKGYQGQPLCPYTIFRPEDLGNLGIDPLVVRPRVHSQGRHVYVANNAEELAMYAVRCGGGWYASTLINKVSEYRVTFVQGRVAWVAKKTPGNPEDVAWNVARGGRFDNVRFDNWPLKAVRISLEAFLLSGLDFGAVDVMLDADGSAYVLEINSAPSQTSPYRQKCMAKCFDYLIENGKGTLPVTQARGGWKKFIHPAIHADSIMEV